MKDRIRQIMESQHMTQQSFAQFIGLNAASLSSIFNGRTKPTLNTVEAIKTKIPTISSDWLLFGRGDMYEHPRDVVTNEPITEKAEDDNPVLDFSGGDGNSLFSSASTLPPQRIVSQQPKEMVRHELKFIDKPQRKIIEIRVFYDDSTYDTFVPK